MEHYNIKKDLGYPKSFKFLMAGVAGVEPTWMVLETIILPLNYTPNSIYKEYNTKKKLFQHFYLKPYYNIGDFMAIIKYTTK